MAGLIGQANAQEFAMSASSANTIAGSGLRPPVPLPPVRMASTETIVSAPKPTTSAPVNHTAQAFDSKFRGTPLEGKWGLVKASAEKHGLDPSLAAAVMAHESGNGKHVSGNNPGGLMDPATKWSKKIQFDSIDKGIDATVGTIAKNYNRAGGDLSKLANIYAPQGAANDKTGLNKHWLPGVKKQMSYFGGEI